ncbi:MAG: DUF3164 family protein [Planktomarina sp.]
MTDIPAGYMKDAKGALIPQRMVKPQHKLEDDMVKELFGRAMDLNGVLRTFKTSVFEEVTTFRQLLADQYDVQRGGKKGNMTFRSFDGTMEVQIAVGENLTFGPELEVAKELIDHCIERWSVGANDNIKVLVQDAFQTNKQGRIDTARVLGLRRLSIDDPEWNKAMDAIGDAVRSTVSKNYARFYKIDPETGTRTPVSLDIAAV